MAFYISAFCQLLIYIWAKFGLTCSPFFRRFYEPWRPNFPFSRPAFQGQQLRYIEWRRKFASPIYGAKLSFFCKGFQCARDHSIDWILSPSLAFYFSTFCHLLVYIWPTFGLTFSPFSGVSKVFPLEFRSARPAFWLISMVKNLPYNDTHIEFASPYMGWIFLIFFI